VTSTGLTHQRHGEAIISFIRTVSRYPVAGFAGIVTGECGNNQGGGEVFFQAAEKLSGGCRDWPGGTVGAQGAARRAPGDGWLRVRPGKPVGRPSYAHRKPKGRPGGLALSTKPIYSSDTRLILLAAWTTFQIAVTTRSEHAQYRAGKDLRVLWSWKRAGPARASRLRMALVSISPLPA